MATMRSLLLRLLPVVGVYQAACQQYDYVVVGSGPGGGPLAVDLAKAGYSVLLLEAGSDLVDDPVYTDVSRATEATNDPRSRWDFFVKHSDDPARELKYEHMTWRTGNGSFYVGLDPPEGSQQLGVYYPRAATLGGCAMHNAAILDLPSDANWDYIANITGDESWRATEMRKIYEEIENCHYSENKTAGHGYLGWLDTSRGDPSWSGNASDGTAILKAIVDASNAAGNASADQLREQLDRDINGANPHRDQLTGVFGMATHTDAEGHRSSPANYIHQAFESVPFLPLTLELNSYLTRIVWDQMQDFYPPAVMAVEYAIGPSAYKADPRHDPNRNTTRGFAYVTKEVIVAGGAFNSPQILKVSGVGPAEELNKHNISVVADVQGVGRNLGDNYEGGVVSMAARPLTDLGGQYSVQLKTSASQGDRDIFLWPSHSSFEGFWPGFPDDHGPEAVTFAFAQMDQRSHEGTVMLRSGDPLEPPEINFRFFEKGGDEDLQSMVDAVRFVKKVQSEVSGSSGIAPFEELHPCPKSSSSNCTDAQIKENIKLQAYSHHASGTCAIGNPASDPMAVVDSKFKVRAVKGLRVVDASVFPRPPGAFPVLPTFMVSRKASKAILEELASLE
ncbi:GMC oxidoreductase [Xylariaceae sp. FL0016]|nr:GMC oxidoreductase [Xylariaceae sp. FL0016]